MSCSSTVASTAPPPASSPTRHSAAAHAMERRMTGEKIRDAYRYATQRGQMVGQVPGGYIRNQDGSISIDEGVAPAIRRIFEMYSTGRFTARDIARRFN